MAIYSHEGQPRSGKSYEAAVYVILESIKKGRKVWAYIEGLNHKKFAELANITIEQCHELLVEINEDDVKNIPKKCYDEGWKDGWVVIDEIQDFYPSGRQQLDKITTKFITRHGHEGLDVLIMGQSLSDVHKLWRVRTQQKTQFLKQDAIGKQDSYLWTVFRAKLDANGNPKFNKISSGSKKYEQKYFGLYQSHSEGTENTDNHIDSRANVFKTPLFTRIIPSFLALAFFAFYFLYGFFTQSLVNENKTESVNTAVKKDDIVKYTQPKIIQPRLKNNLEEIKIATLKKKTEALEKELDLLKNPPDYISNLITKNRPRLQMLLYTGKKTLGYIEFLDSSFRSKERLSLIQLKSLGWDYKLVDDYLVISKNDDSHIVTAWPIEPFAKSSNHATKRLSGTKNKRQIAQNTYSTKKTKYGIIKNIK